MTYGADLARFYAASGVPIFPVDLVLSKDGRKWDKKPLIRAWYKSATCDADTVAGWWRRWPNAAVGLPLGAVECVALDADIRPEQGIDGAAALGRLLAEHPGALAPLISYTPSGGFHAVFRSPGNEIGNSPKGLPPGIDVRGAGGFIVAPGSVRPDGAGWRPDRPLEQWAAGLAVAGPLPPGLHARLVAGSQAAAGEILGPVVGPDRSSTWGIERAREAVRWYLDNSPPGTANNHLNELCFHRLGRLVASGELTYADAELMALEAIHEHGDDEQRSRGTMTSAFNALAAGKLKDFVPPPEMLFGPPVPPPPAGKGFIRSPLGYGLQLDFSEARPKLPSLPIVDGIAYENHITLFAGQSYSGKTTFLFSLVAAAIGGIRNFQTPKTGPHPFGLTMRPANWLYVSGEGCQRADEVVATWLSSHSVYAQNANRLVIFEHKSPMIQVADRGGPITSEFEMQQITYTAKQMKLRNPDEPLIAVFDNAQTALEDLSAAAHATRFMQLLAKFKDEVSDCAVILVTHPPKSQESVFQGSGAFANRVDVVVSLGLKDKTNHTGPRILDHTKCRPDSSFMSKQITVHAKRPDEPRFIVADNELRGGTEEWRARQIEQVTRPYYISDLEVTKRPDPETSKPKSKAQEIIPVGPIGAPGEPPFAAFDRKRIG